MLENNLIASALVGSVNITGTFFLTAPSSKRFAKILARSDCSPTIILDGYKLSCKVFPSCKNSGENIILSVLSFFFISAVYLTGTVDLIIISF